MAFPRFWRGDRERNEDSWRRNRSDSDAPRNRFENTPRGEGFRRRGWREGSDYYGNDAERYGAEYDEFGNRVEGEQSPYGSSDEWRRNERDEPFNDRWESSYEGSNAPARYGFSERTFDQGNRIAGSPFGGSRDRPSNVHGSSFDRGTGQFRGRGPKGYRRSDERVREDVCECLTDDPWVDASNISVNVQDCEVTLSGTVNSRDEKRRAEALVERVSGVKDVHNQLRTNREESTSTAATETNPSQQAPRH